MTDWKPGDKFRLECEGEIKRAPNDTRLLGVRLHDHEYELDRTWFDAHATKVQRPFEFGDLVSAKHLYGERLQYRVLEDLGDSVRVWPIGSFQVQVLPKSALHLQKAT